MLFRLTAVLALFAALVSAQPAPPAPAIPTEAQNLLQPDLEDPVVVRAQQDLERVRPMVSSGALPPMHLKRAQDALEAAKDNSILRQGAYTTDISPAQAEQMVTVATRLVQRAQQTAAEMRRLLESGAISRLEAQQSQADYSRMQNDLDLARQRALLALSIADAVRARKAMVEVEIEAEAHPEWNGSVFIRYDGSGAFSRDDFQKVSVAFMTKFAKPMPVSADGATAVHKALGFNHAGRVDVALRPETIEGRWLMGYLQTKHIPYIAFRQAVAHQATGPHIHIGPRSPRLALAN